jgi:ADP-ribose pyrophosphatase YjhB (NUDIX family)
MPPGGWARDHAEPAPRTIETFLDQGRPCTATWLDPPFRPEPPDCNQAYGICFDEWGQVVLVRLQGDYWNLPGGGVEPGETLEKALVREVREEACARVIASQYIGCQRINDPEHPDGPQRYYQSRFWARVELAAWEGRFEAGERRLVSPQEFLVTLAWGEATTASIILEAGLRIEAARARLTR